MKHKTGFDSLPLLCARSHSLELLLDRSDSFEITQVDLVFDHLIDY